MEGVELQDGHLHIAPVKATETRAFANRLEAIMPPARITELLHKVNRATGFASAFTNLRTGERCDDQRPARRHPGRRHQLRPGPHGSGQPRRHPRQAGPYIRADTYKAALGRIIDAQYRQALQTIFKFESFIRFLIFARHSQFAARTAWQALNTGVSLDEHF